MSESADRALRTGCRPRSRAAPRRLCPRSRCADALETIEFAEVRRAGRRAAPPARSAPRACGARRPTDDVALDRRRAGAGGRGGRPLPPGRRAARRSRSRTSRRALAPAPDRGQRARGRRAGRGSSACSWPPGWCTPISAAWPRPRRSPPRSLVRCPRQDARAAAGAVASTPTAACSTPRARASPPARREVHAARQRLLRKLETLLRGLDAERGAGGRQRDGARRPVRHPGPPRLAAAVPAASSTTRSGSAGTLFIEPAEAIELGNALREAEVEEERETLRVLRELTDLLRPELPALRDVGGDVRRGGRSGRPRALRRRRRGRGARGGAGAGRPLGS